MEGKHIKNDNFHPIIQFRKGQTFLAKSNSPARLSVIGILQYSCQHLEIICLPTGTPVTLVGFFPKQRRKTEELQNCVRCLWLSTFNKCWYCRDDHCFQEHICSCLICLRKKKKEESSVAKVPQLHNHLHTVGADLANASELGAYYREYPY